MLTAQPPDSLEPPHMKLAHAFTSGGRVVAAAMPHGFRIPRIYSDRGPLPWCGWPKPSQVLSATEYLRVVVRHGTETAHWPYEPDGSPATGAMALFFVREREPCYREPCGSTPVSRKTPLFRGCVPFGKTKVLLSDRPNFSGRFVGAAIHLEEVQRRRGYGEEEVWPREGH